MSEIFALATSVVGCVTVVVTLVTPCVRDPLTDTYNHMRLAEERWAEFEDKMKKLKELMKKLGMQFDNKTSRIYSQWKIGAEKLLKLGSELQMELNRTGCWVPFFCVGRYKVGKNILDNTKTINDCLEHGRVLVNCSEELVVGYQRAPAHIVGAKNKESVLKIWDAVTKEAKGTTVILVYGMAGCGKKSIVTEVYNRVLKAIDSDHNNGLHFTKVIWVTVPYEYDPKASDLQQRVPDIGKLQMDIADKIPAPDVRKASDIGERARKLSHALDQNTFLLVIDNACRDFATEKVGIPEATDNSKVIIISRWDPALCNNIHAPADQHFPVETLDEIEAWDLFNKKVQDRIGFGKKRWAGDIDREFVQENCEGLPLAITYLADALVRKSLKSCARSSADSTSNEVFFRSIDGFNIMESDEFAKSFAGLVSSYWELDARSQACLRYCALFPIDHYFEEKELARYWVWEGLVDDMIDSKKTTKLNQSGRIRSIEVMLKEARDILSQLKSSYFLVPLNTNNKPGDTITKRVKMPRVVRRMVFHIIKQSSLARYFIHHKRSERCPMDWDEDITRASIMQNGMSGLPHKLATNCPNLVVLLIVEEPNVLTISEVFFDSVPNLQFLDLSHSKIARLQGSPFEILTKLRVLLFRGCSYLDNLLCVSQLSNLLVLDLSGTPITELPEGIENLTNLIHLNLSNNKLTSLKAEMIKKLTLLQELLMLSDRDDRSINNKGYSWKSKHMSKSEDGETCMEDLAQLQRLKVLKINVQTEEAFNESYNHESLFFPVNSLFCMDETIGGGDGCKVLVQKVFVSNEPFHLPKRTCHLLVWNNPDINFLHVITHKLENLTAVSVSDCEHLIYLFEKTTLEHLPNLKRVFIEGCQAMTRVINSDSEEFSSNSRTTSSSTSITLPKLEEMVLSNLPRLEHIYNGRINCEALQKIVVLGCNKLKMPTPLEAKKEATETAVKSPFPVRKISKIEPPPKSSNTKSEELGQLRKSKSFDKGKYANAKEGYPVAQNDDQCPSEESEGDCELQGVKDPKGQGPYDELREPLLAGHSGPKGRGNRTKTKKHSRNHGKSMKLLGFDSKINYDEFDYNY